MLPHILNELHRRFPGVCFWWGRSTGSWWAMADGRLVEAASPADLDRALRDLAHQTTPRPTAAPRAPDAIRAPVAARPPVRRRRGGWLGRRVRGVHHR
ncbi:hypothetical protein [Actinomadura hibisca]|uniref:hypothetical protein n=1 Tax=Actinomadura hibisca TaxID=68565 RepID=UPI000A6C99FC|nr:hypothetical protein [Actinomadura hibisca]